MGLSRSQPKYAKLGSQYIKIRDDLCFVSTDLLFQNHIEICGTTACRQKLLTSLYLIAPRT